MAQKFALALDGAAYEVELDTGGSDARIRLADRWYAVELEATGRPNLYSLLIDGRSYEVYAEARPGGWEVLIGVDVFSIDTGPSRGPRGRNGVPAPPSGAWELRSPLAGIVVDVRVQSGDEVEQGQVLLVVESMKMNNELVAARAGRVTAVQAAAGDRVERGAPLVRIE